MSSPEAPVIQGPPIATGKQVGIFAILLALIVCYTTFLTADVFTGNHNNTWSWIVKHLAGILCFVLTLLIGTHAHDKRDRLLIQLALGLAVLGDLFMGFNMRLPGTAVFVLVQLVLILRHARLFVWNRTELIAALCVFIPIGGVLWYLSEPMMKAGLLVPAIVYTAILATSVWIGIGVLWRHYYSPTISRIVAIAIVSFFLCDLSLGLLDDKPREKGLDGIQQAAEIDDHASFIQQEAAAVELAARSKNPLDVAAGPVEQEVTQGFAAAADEFASLRTVTAEKISAEIPNPLMVGIGVFIWFFYLPALTLLAMSGFRLDYLRSIVPVIPVRRWRPFSG